MPIVLLWTARLAGAAGIVLTLAAGIARLAGMYQVGSFQSITLLQAGTAAIALGSFSYLATLAEKSK